MRVRVVLVVAVLLLGVAVLASCGGTTATPELISVRAEAERRLYALMFWVLILVTFVCVVGILAVLSCVARLLWREYDILRYGSDGFAPMVRYRRGDMMLVLDPNKLAGPVSVVACEDGTLSASVPVVCAEQGIVTSQFQLAQALRAGRVQPSQAVPLARTFSREASVEVPFEVVPAGGTADTAELVSAVVSSMPLCG